jgi:hypothetical protein
VKFHTLSATILREGRTTGKIRSIRMLSVINLSTSGIPAEITSLKVEFESGPGFLYQ